MRAQARVPGIDTARVDRALSLSQLATQAASDSAFVEPWANLSAWSPSNTAQVSGGKLYGLGTTQNPAGGARNVTITSGSRFRYVGTVDLVAGGSGFVGIGIRTDSGTLTSTPANTRMWGLTGQVAQKYAAGTFSDMTDIAGSGGGTSLAAGAYRISITGDESGIRVSLTNAARSVEYTDYVSWATAGSQASIVVWVADTRATSGTALRGVSLRLSTNTASPRGVYEDVAPELASGLSGSATLQVRLPADYDSTVASPLAIYYHGSGGSASAAWSDSIAKPVVTALLSAGYIVASVDAGGSNWGNQAAVDLYGTLYQYVRDHYAIGQVFHLAQSMGGLASLLTLAERKVPAAAWSGIYPVCNLRDLYDNTGAQGNFAPNIRTAYGIASDGSDYAAKTAGHDPALMDGRAFRGLPMQFFASASDTVVRQTTNTDAFRTLVASYAQASTLVTCTGEHGDASHSQPSVVVDFFNSYRYEPAQLPPAPTGLAGGGDTGQVSLTWTAPPFRGATTTDYVVQYRTTSGPGAWTTFADGTSSSTVATVTGLTDGTSYDFRVAAVNGIGQGDWSSTVTASAGDAVGLASLISRLDASAITPQSDNTALSAWVDSKNGASLAAANAPSASNSPTYRTSGPGGKPYVQFRTASTQAIGSTGNPYTTTSQSFTFFAVISGQNQAWPYRMAAGAGRTLLQAWNSGKWSWFGSGVTDIGNLSSGTWIVLEMVHTASTSWEARINGSVTGSAASAIAGVTTGTGNLFVGIANASPWYRPDADIAELLLYDAALTSPQRSAIRAYLGAKYGITVA